MGEVFAYERTLIEGHLNDVCSGSAELVEVEVR